MEIFKNIWTKITSTLLVLIGLFWLLLRRKNKQIEELKTALDTVDTQRKADVLETEIKQKLDQVEVKKQEAKEYQNTLIQLEEKRKEIQQKQAKVVDPSEIEKYWNK